MKTKQGISLIGLVITIIVMVVLAGAIVLTLNNSGIIDKASEAVDKTNYMAVKELTQMAWAEAYANGARTQQEFQAAVDKALTDNKIDADRYGIIVTTNGVEVANGWIQDGLKVKRGEDVLTIGDDFKYDETANGTVDVETDVHWKILGASDEGELLIISSSDIYMGYCLGGSNLGDYSDLDKWQNDWLTGADQLDELCEPYKYGEKATGARSIRVEDVNKITGYDPEIEKYGKGQLYEYGNEVTYTYNGTTEPAYTATNKLSGTLSATHSNGFHYYNGTDFIVAGLSNTTGIITTLKSDSYSYYPGDLETIDKTSKAYTMLFGEYGAEFGPEGTWYWLASPYVSTGTICASFGLRSVEYGNVCSSVSWHSDGSFSVAGDFNVRAVVSLDSDIQVTGNSTDGWSY